MLYIERASPREWLWFVFYRVDGKLVRDVFDKHPVKSLKAAREEARKRLELVGRGQGGGSPPQGAGSPREG